jgi:hypothetical protein
MCIIAVVIAPADILRVYQFVACARENFNTALVYHNVAPFPTIDCATSAVLAIAKSPNNAMHHVCEEAHQPDGEAQEADEEPDEAVAAAAT